MVHALEESWRVLAAEGMLIDIRPRLGNMRLEVLSEQGDRLAGLADDSALVSDYKAVMRTLDQGVRDGRFFKEEEQFFDFAYYWDTLEDFEVYVQENWVNRRVPKKLLRKARKMEVDAEGSTRIRIRDERVIARYRKRMHG
jgi:hypothetical protein